MTYPDDYYYTELMKTATIQYPILTGSTTKILDDYELNKLIQNKFDGPRFLDISTLTYTELSPIKEFFSKYKLKRIHAILKQSTPPVTDIIYSEFSLAASYVIEQLKTFFPSARIHVQYKKIALDTRQLKALLSKNNVVINSAFFYSSQLSHIEE